MEEVLDNKELLFFTNVCCLLLCLFLTNSWMLLEGSEWVHALLDKLEMGWDSIGMWMFNLMMETKKDASGREVGNHLERKQFSLRNAFGNEWYGIYLSFSHYNYLLRLKFVWKLDGKNVYKKIVWLKYQMTVRVLQVWTQEVILIFKLSTCNETILNS